MSEQIKTSFPKVNTKNRKRVRYALFLVIIVLQLLLGLDVYNDFFNESKLRDLEADVYIAEQASKFSNHTQQDYIDAQYSL